MAMSLLMALASSFQSQPVHLDLYLTHDCSGKPNASVDLTAATASYAHCTHCWDRCAAGVSASSMRLRGPAGATVALNKNCVGAFQYAGGWTDGAFGGTLSPASGCRKGGASAVVLCDGTVDEMDADLAVVCGRPTPVPPNHTWPTRPFHVLDPAMYAPMLGDDAEWAARTVPYVDLPDSDLLRAFYYRWRVLKKHILYTGTDGFVITEFLPYVPWSGTHNTIPAAAGHHIMEARWLHDPQVASDYLSLWLSGRGDPLAYSSWIGAAAWERQKLLPADVRLQATANATAAALARIYMEKVKRYQRKTGRGVACFFQTDGKDAMEESVSGSGCRPTMAAIMWAEAMAVARFASLGGNASLAADFEQRAAATRQMILSLHWNPALSTFGVVPLASDAETDDSTTAAVARASGCNLKAVRSPDVPASVRELLGFIPYYFDGIVPPQEPKYRAQFASLDDPDGFASPWGLRTTERRHPCYNYSWEHGDCWNGPSWPYETARVLTGAANAIHAAEDAKVGAPLSREQYLSMLLTYARQHTRSTAVNDTASPKGSGHVFENLHPDLGYWNNRQQMYWRQAPMRDQGNDYLHSTFCDLVLAGLIGIRPEVNGTVRVRPLVPTSGPGAWDRFAADHVLVRGRVLSVVWDRTGTAYNRGKGLSVLVDGRAAATSDTLTELVVELP